MITDNDCLSSVYDLDDDNDEDEFQSSESIEENLSTSRSKQANIFKKVVRAKNACSSTSDSEDVIDDKKDKSSTKVLNSLEVMAHKNKNEVDYINQKNRAQLQTYRFLLVKHISSKKAPQRRAVSCGCHETEGWLRCANFGV